MDPPVNVYDEADYIAHSLSPRQQYGGMIYDTSSQPLAYFGVEFHCDTQARSFCTQDDDGSNNLVDYVLLTHTLRFIPEVSTTWRGWDRYRFFVRALDKDASASLQQGNPISASDLGNWFNNETAPGTLQTASILQSSPPTSNIGQTFSSSVGSNMGFNAGFFGDEPTATYSQGQDMSKSFSYSMDNVSVQDYSKETIINKQFTINHLDMNTTLGLDAKANNHTDFGFTTYEVTVAELFKIPDDGQGDRNKTNPTVFRRFEIALQAERDLKTDTWTDKANEDMVSLTTNVRQIISVKAPPLPRPAS
ncbi:hypothetical protein ACSS6W_010496 [Trichoderma asperelloides]|uniref:Uncharacterized protein n=1 Tax=Trichoderma asperellum TaxID=101201 RepID=A0A6V8QXQ8_TRIAP|nr:hypothetical protein LI328DRAFT_90565 [Trichoderma asperelloides]GFP57239.1 hypothetical protein TASIC1_0008008000 [Trichoderma asperellum]